MKKFDKKKPEISTAADKTLFKENRIDVCHISVCLLLASDLLFLQNQ